MTVKTAVAAADSSEECPRCKSNDTLVINQFNASGVRTGFSALCESCLKIWWK